VNNKARVFVSNNIALRGEKMKKRYLTLVFAFVAVLSLSAGVVAQERHELNVKVPFDFYAAGKNMPAGEYAVTRISENGLNGLRLSTDDGKATVYVLPTEFAGSSDGAAAKMGFERVGSDRFLSYIVTEGGTYNISFEKSVETVARMKQHGEGNSGR
jgi:hypothetical protein